VRIQEVRWDKGGLNYQAILHSSTEVGLKIINNRSMFLLCMPQTEKRSDDRNDSSSEGPEHASDEICKHYTFC
jgi:hypothetical protein